MTRRSGETRAWVLAGLACPLVGLLVLAGLWFAGTPLSDLWASPDQRAVKAYQRGDYVEAAELFTDSGWRGMAWFRAGEFERAAIAFVARDDAVASFNRGNAWVMRGKYDQALAAYDRALEFRPGWAPAVENREISRLRKAKMKGPDDDSGGTGGMLGADEIVVDNRPKGASDEMEVGEGDALSDAENQALWLKRVQTSPADFLRSKFAWQHQVEQSKPQKKSQKNPEQKDG